jgi:hypothetical protein
MKHESMETWNMKYMKHEAWNMKHENWNMKHEHKHETWNIFYET